MGNNEFDNGANHDYDQYYSFDNSGDSFYETDHASMMYTDSGERSGYDKRTFDAASHAAISFREQSVLVKSIAFMCLALLISAVAAFAGYAYGQTHIYEYVSFLMPALVIELVVYFVTSFALHKGKTMLSVIGYVCYAVMSGITLSVIFFAYSAGSIAFVFVITAIMFGAMACYGYMTKTDLKPLGTFFAMSLIGLICLGVLNIFITSDGFTNIVAVVGVVLFAGITAYDIQRLKELNVAYADRSETIVALYGGLQLYLDFVNIFLKLLRLFGKSRD